MSLNEKYTKEELDAIRPFTGFHHNKVKEELLEKAAQAIKDRCDNLIFDNLVITNATKKSYDGTEAHPNPYYLDEMVTLGLTNEQFKSAWNATKPKIDKPYDADKKPLTNDDEVSPFGKVNLWDFQPLTKPWIKFDYPEINKDIAEAFDLVIEKFKKENKPRDVIQNIVDKIHKRRLSGKECEVAIMSYSDYEALKSMNDFEIHSIKVMGYLLKIHPSPNLKDGEIEIY